MEINTIYLITRGDDSGSSETANIATLDAYRQGILKNASIMVPCQHFESAARMFSQEKGLCCGVHCTVTAEWEGIDWKPILPPEQVPTLVDKNGNFFRRTHDLYDNNINPSELMAELQAQLDKARECGLDIKYADTHMAFGWTNKDIPEEFDKWCTREGIINALNFTNRLPDATVDGDPIERVISKLQAATPGVYALIGHPAYDTEEMRTFYTPNSSGEKVAISRDWDRRYFMDPRMIEYCRKNYIVPVRYDEAAKLI